MRVSHLGLVTLGLVVGTSAGAAAQDLGWKGAIEASGNVIFGAARGRVASLQAGAGRADSTVEIQSDLLLSYADARAGDDPRRVTARSSRLSLGIDLHPFARLSPFAFTSVESSLQQRVDLRSSGGAGAKYTFYRKDEDDLSASLALLWERTRSLDPLPGADPVSTRARWSMRFRMRRQLTEAVRFTHVTFYQPSVDDLQRYNAETNTSIAVALNTNLSLTAGLRDRYDSEARRRGARSNHDGQLLFGVRAAF
jgi:hypothetical protein